MGRDSVPENDDRSLGIIRLFDDLSSDSMRDIEESCRWREYDTDEKIIDRFSDGGEVYFVVNGTVEILNYSYSGREIAFARVRGGGYFGELAAIDGKPRSATDPRTHGSDHSAL